MKRILLFVFLQLVFYASCYPQSEEEVVIDRYREFLIRTTTQTPAQIQSLVNGLQSVDKKIEIKNVEQAKLAVLKILQTTRDLSLAWSTPGSFANRDTLTLDLLHNALLDCIKFINKNPDWGLSQPDVARSVRDIVLVLGSDLPEGSRNKCIEIIKQHRLQGSGAGSDLILTNELGMHYGALTKDVQHIRRCRDFILSEIRISDTDGIQPDMSFHWQGKRLNIFRYGKTFLHDNIRVAWQLRNTSCAFPDEKENLLADVVLQSWQWMARGTTTVPGALDSFVTNENALQSADIRSLIPFLTDLSPGKAEAFNRLERIQNGSVGPFGAHYWPYSDFMAYHRRDFSFFIKTISERTLSPEFVEGQSRRLNLLNNGNTYLVHDGKEYLNLMPVWNWRQLPGATSYTKGTSVERNVLAGNVNNGKSSLTAMHIGLRDSTQRQNMSAHKVWAIHNGVMVCLISDIKGSLSGNVVTTLDQCRWRGPVTVNTPGNILKEGSNKLPNVRWVHHAGFAYIPIALFGTSMNIELKTATGNWKSIDRSQNSNAVTEKIFHAMIDHGHVTDSYRLGGYVVAHAPSAQQADSIAGTDDWHVLKNDAACQAVRFKSDRTIMMVFFSPAKIVNLKIDKIDFEVNKPCLVLIEDGKLFVSDLAYSGGPVQITWNGRAFNAVMPPNGATVEVKSNESP
jgi:chondroitin AC lyase